jgi:hypothetical protein
MRHHALILSAGFAVTLGLAPTAAALLTPGGEAKFTLAVKTLVVDYGRPCLKGRDMLGQAEVGQVWRMGADGATTLDTPVSLTFGTTVVAPGEYVLRAKKTSATDWMLLVQKDGTTAAEVPLVASPLDASVEVFTIDLAEEEGQGVLRLSWGTKALSTRFTAK